MLLVYGVGMTCSDIYIYHPKTTELMVNVIITQSYPEIIVNTISFSYSLVTVTNHVWSVV